MKSRIVVQCNYRYIDWYTIQMVAVEPYNHEVLDAIRDASWRAAYQADKVARTFRVD